MIRHHGGTAVKRGFYLDRAAWEITVIPSPGGVLPGTKETRYTRVPAVALFVLAPLLGALYVVFLPLVGFLIVFRHGLQKAVTGLRHGWTGVGAALRHPAWRD